jgi:hypothetical protein
MGQPNQYNKRRQSIWWVDTAREDDGWMDWKKDEEEEEDMMGEGWLEERREMRRRGRRRQAIVAAMRRWTNWGEVHTHSPLGQGPRCWLWVAPPRFAFGEGINKNKMGEKDE